MIKNNKGKIFFKILILIGLIFCIYTNHSLGTTKDSQYYWSNTVGIGDEIFTYNEVKEGYINKVESLVAFGDTPGYMRVSVDVKKQLELFGNIEDLLQNYPEGIVYEKIYKKLNDNETKAYGTYGEDKESRKEFKIVEFDGVRYVEILIGVLERKENYFYTISSEDNIFAHCNIEILDDTNAITRKDIFKVEFNKAELFAEKIFVQFVGKDDTELSTISNYVLDSNIFKSIYSIDFPSILYYNKAIKNNTPRLQVNTFVDLGDKIELENFGELNKVDSLTEDGITMYVYEIEIVDKSIFENDKLTLNIQIEDININKEITFYFAESKEEAIIERKNQETGIISRASLVAYSLDTTLKVSKIEEGDELKNLQTILSGTEKFVAFNIHFEASSILGTPVQPDSNVKISIPVPEGYDESKLIVYRIDEENNKIEYKVNLENINEVKYATFETEHFSTYVLAENNNTTTTGNNNQLEPNNQKTNENPKGKLDNQPNAGESLHMIYISIMTAGIIFIYGFIKITNKYKVVKDNKTNK